MIGLRLCWFTLEAILVGLFLYTGNGLPLAGAVGLLAAVLCAIPVNLLVRKRLRVTVEVPANIGKGKRGEAVILIENPTHIPVLRMNCTVQVENRLNGDIKKLQLLTFALPRRTNRLTVELGSEYCGRLRLTVEKIALCDCFGLIPVAYRKSRGRSTTIQPNTFDQNLRVVFNAYTVDDSEQYSPDRPGSDLAETFQVREYVEGDSQRQIHWKLTSKLDKLIVRDPSLPVTRSVLVFWERTGGTQDRRLLDAQVEVVATVCKSLAQQGAQFTLGWNDTETQKCILQPVADMDEFIGILPRMLTAKGRQEGPAGAELLVQALGDSMYSHIICIGETISDAIFHLQGLGHVTVLACGTQVPPDAVLFDAENYEAQLSDLEV